MKQLLLLLLLSVAGFAQGTVLNPSNAYPSTCLPGQVRSRISAGTVTTKYCNAAGTGWTDIDSGGGGAGDLVAANNLSDVASTSTARSNLGLAIGTNVQAYDADLGTIAGLTATTDSFLQAKSSAWAVRTIAQVVADLAPSIPDYWRDTSGTARPNGTSDESKLITHTGEISIGSNSQIGTSQLSIASNSNSITDPVAGFFANSQSQGIEILYGGIRKNDSGLGANTGLSINANGTGHIVLHGSPQSETASTGNVGIGVNIPLAKLHTVATTEQLRLGYDGSNYAPFTVSSGGDLTIAPTGGDVAITGNLGLGTGSLTLTGSIGATGARTTKLWATDGEFTNMPTVGGISIATTFQAALVSGTNIKTINSTSLLGSGDIAISATPAGSSGDYQINNGGSFGAGVLAQASGRLTATPSTVSSGVTPYLRIVSPADTGLTADTEALGVVFGGNTSNATVTRTLADGTTIATQREYLFVNPTYAAAGATTLTNAATVAILGSPAAGSNITITNPWALTVGASSTTGNARFQSSTNTLDILPAGSGGAPFIKSNVSMGIDSVSPLAIYIGSVAKLRMETSAFVPQTTDSYDLGSTSRLWQSGWFSKNLLVGGVTAVGTSGVGVIAIKNGTVPSTSPADSVQLYAEDVTASSELKVRDEAGNIAVLSPHNPRSLALFQTPADEPAVPWAGTYTNVYAGKIVHVDMLKLAREVERLGGKQIIHIEDLPSDQVRDWDTDEESKRLKRIAEQEEWDAKADDEKANSARPADYVKKEEPKYIKDRKPRRIR